MFFQSRLLPKVLSFKQLTKHCLHGRFLKAVLRNVESNHRGSLQTLAHRWDVLVGTLPPLKNAEHKFSKFSQKGRSGDGGGGGEGGFRFVKWKGGRGGGLKKWRYPITYFYTNQPFPTSPFSECVLACVLLIYTTSLSILCVSWEESSFIECNQEKYGFYKSVIFEMQRHCGIL